MSTTPSSSLLSPVKLPAQPGMILRFVDAFPSAAAAVKPARSTRTSRRKIRPAADARSEVVVVRL
ncbi:hypothetical protein [Opitutus terrae]|nr:hypothetical protein [Opitutus terrae]